MKEEKCWASIEEAAAAPETKSYFVTLKPRISEISRHADISRTSQQKKKKKKVQRRWKPKITTSSTDHRSSSSSSKLKLK